MAFFNSEFDQPAVAPSAFPRLLHSVLERQPVPRAFPNITFAHLPDNAGPFQGPTHSVLLDNKADGLPGANNGSTNRVPALPTGSPSPRDDRSLSEPPSAGDQNGYFTQVPFSRFREAKQRLFPKRPFNKALLADALAQQDRAQPPTPQLPLVSSPAV